MNDLNKDKSFSTPEKKTIHFKNIFLLVLPDGREQKSWNYKI